MNLSIDEIFAVERDFLVQGYDAVIGIDEAGRGPLAGPVTAAAVAWRNLPIEKADSQRFFKQLALIKDSKKLSEKRREELFDFIQDNFFVGVGICDHITIDRINILEATYLAMRNAVAQLNSKLKIQNPNARCLILVDGNKEIPNLSIEQRAIVGGDNFVKSISAASIIAKVTRDRMMMKAHVKYPQYNFLQHKGYGTKIHMEALKKFGPCEIHRRSFRPVRDVEDMYRMTINQ